jgi:hypothetical protein
MPAQDPKWYHCSITGTGARGKMPKRAYNVYSVKTNRSLELCCAENKGSFNLPFLLENLCLSLVSFYDASIQETVEAGIRLALD